MESAVDLETLLTHPLGFGLETATPVQRAACRVLSGRPLGDLADHPDVLAACGGVLPRTGQPLEFVLLAAIRSGKSLISAAAAVWTSQTCNVSKLGAGEIPRVSVMSVRRDQADVVLNQHIIGRVTASKMMRRWMVGEPVGDSITLRHPSGRPVEIKVVAGSRAGSSLVARWSAGVIFDEAPRMVGAEDGVVNLEESQHAVRGRMLPGAPIIYIGSPWAPFGPVYTMVAEHFGKPSNDIVVMRATGPMMNPGEWTEEKIDRLRRVDPQAYRTDVLGEFADPEEALFSDQLLREITRKAPTHLEPERLHHYSAAMDPATRSNAWTFVVIGCREDGHYFVAFTKQWMVRKGDRLSPKQVLSEIAVHCARFELEEVHTDQFSADALRDLADEVDVPLVDHTIGKNEKYEMVAGLHTIISEKRLELSPDTDVHRDLAMVKKKVIQNGISFVFPKTADGRHCDYAPALALAMQYPPEPPDLLPQAMDWARQQREKLRERAESPWYEQAAGRMMGAA